MDSCLRALVLLLVAASPSAASRQQLRGLRTNDFANLAGAMQPTVAARTLASVETEWRSQALQFVECKADAARSDCGLVQSAFQKTCGKIVSAVVAASSGDRETVTEYMAVVCNEPQLNGWKHERCQSFAKAISNTMTADSYQNRVELKTGGLCLGFWLNMSSAEGARVAQEHALQAKRLEEEHAKAAKQAKEAAEELAKATAAKNKKIAAEAKREAKRREIQEKRRAVEEQHKRQVAERAAREAKEAKLAAEREAAAKAAAAKRAAQKAAVEAGTRQRNEAARKAAEAQAAEADAKLAQAKHDEQETKRNLADVEAAKVAQSVKNIAAATHPAKPQQAAKADHSAKKVTTATQPEKTQQAPQPHAAVPGDKITNHKQ